MPPAAKLKLLLNFSAGSHMTNMREVTNAMLYLASSSCQWRMLPKDFPPISTVRWYLHDWRNRAVLAAINDLLVRAARDLEGREASPTADICRNYRDPRDFTHYTHDDMSRRSEPF